MRTTAQITVLPADVQPTHDAHDVPSAATTPAMAATRATTDAPRPRRREVAAVAAAAATMEKNSVLMRPRRHDFGVIDARVRASLVSLRAKPKREHKQPSQQCSPQPQQQYHSPTHAAPSDDDVELGLEELEEETRLRASSTDKDVLQQRKANVEIDLIKSTWLRKDREQSTFVRKYVRHASS